MPRALSDRSQSVSSRSERNHTRNRQSQSVIQQISTRTFSSFTFTVPPRAHPSTQLSIRLRRSRSTISTEYSLPGIFTAFCNLVHVPPLQSHAHASI